MTAAGQSREVDALVLATADDEMMMGHQWSEWICVAPFLEEDLAVCSIGQDELGHAQALYSLLTDDVDRLALRRAPGDYRSGWLCELATPAWEDALARHFLYDLGEEERWLALADSDPDRLGGLAAQAQREERYHRTHAVSMVERLADPGTASRARLLDAIDRLVPLAAAQFDDLPAAYPRFRTTVDAVLDGCGHSMRWPAEPPTGQGRAGVRSSHFEALQRRLNAVVDLDPSATW